MEYEYNREWTEGAELVCHDEYGKLWRKAGGVRRGEDGRDYEPDTLVIERREAATTYWFRVPPTIRTVKEAVAWSFDEWRVDGVKPEESTSPLVEFLRAVSSLPRGHYVTLSRAPSMSVDGADTIALHHYRQLDAQHSAPNPSEDELMSLTADTSSDKLAMNISRLTWTRRQELYRGDDEHVQDADHEE